MPTISVRDPDFRLQTPEERAAIRRKRTGSEVHPAVIALRNLAALFDEAVVEELARLKAARLARR
jgi:hypothetical protein